MDTGTILTTYTEANVVLPYRRYMMYPTFTGLFIGSCVIFGHRIDLHPWVSVVGATFMVVLLVWHPKIYNIDNPRGGLLKYVIPACTRPPHLIE